MIVFPCFVTPGSVNSCEFGERESLKSKCDIKLRSSQQGRGQQNPLYRPSEYLELKSGQTLPTPPLVHTENALSLSLSTSSARP